jgi:ATP-dependent helicase HrpA
VHVEERELTAWTLGELPRRVEHRRGTATVQGYPALVDEGATVGVRVFEDEAEQAHAMRLGTRRMLLLALPSPVVSIVKRLDNRTKLTLASSPYPDVLSMLEDCTVSAVDYLMTRSGGPTWDAAGFERLTELVRADLHAITYEDVTTVASVLALTSPLRARVAELSAPAVKPVAEDLRAQLSWLVHEGFVSETGHEQLVHLPRYLRAIDRRLDRLAEDPFRDDRSMLVVQEVEDHWDEVYDRLPAHRRADPDVRAARWMIEELRVSLFAQNLGTAYPVSPKRIRNALAALARP